MFLVLPACVCMFISGGFRQARLRLVHVNLVVTVCTLCLPGDLHVNGSHHQILALAKYCHSFQGALICLFTVSSNPSQSLDSQGQIFAASTLSQTEQG